jgi:hypothetical protein
MTRHVRMPALVGLVLAGLLLWPVGAHSHQRQLLHVGQSDYLIVIGSLNEPVFTGDKTGVDLTVLVPDPADPMDSRAANVKPVEGLEKTLKVEIRRDRTRGPSNSSRASGIRASMTRSSIRPWRRRTRTACSGPCRAPPST